MPGKSAKAAAQKAQSYPLFLRQGSLRRVFGLADQGVSLTPDEIAFAIAGAPKTRRYAEIETVRLATGAERLGRFGICTVTFKAGPVLSVYGCNDDGKADPERAATYRAFVTDLHRRLERHAPPVQFVTGTASKMQGPLLGALGLVALALIVVPVFLLVSGNKEAVWPLLAGLVFIWPLYRMSKTSASGTYDPEDIPPDLLP